MTTRSTVLGTLMILAVALSACTPPPSISLDYDLKAESGAEGASQVSSTGASQTEELEEQRQDAEGVFLKEMQSFEGSYRELGMTRLDLIKSAYTVCNETDASIRTSVEEAFPYDAPSTQNTNYFNGDRWRHDAGSRATVEFWQNVRAEAILSGMCGLTDPQPRRANDQATPPPTTTVAATAAKPGLKTIGDAQEVALAAVNGAYWFTVEQSRNHDEGEEFDTRAFDRQRQVLLSARFRIEKLLDSGPLSEQDQAQAYRIHDSLEEAAIAMSRIMSSSASRRAEASDYLEHAALIWEPMTVLSDAIHDANWNS